MGIFSPLLREVVETFGFAPTPLEEGVRRTLVWYGQAHPEKAARARA